MHTFYPMRVSNLAVDTEMEDKLPDPSMPLPAPAAQPPSIRSIALAELPVKKREMMTKSAAEAAMLETLYHHLSQVRARIRQRILVVSMLEKLRDIPRKGETRKLIIGTLLPDLLKAYNPPCMVSHAKRPTIGWELAKKERLTTIAPMLQRTVPLNRENLYLLRLNKMYGLGTDVLQCLEKPTDQMENISETLARSWERNLPAKNTVAVSLHWPLRHFLKSQFVDAPSQKQRFGSIITLTGSAADAQAVTVDQYLSQTWPEIASKLLKLLPETLDSRINHSQLKKGTLWLALQESSIALLLIYLIIFLFGFGFLSISFKANLIQSVSHLAV